MGWIRSCYSLDLLFDTVALLGAAVSLNWTLKGFHSIDWDFGECWAGRRNSQYLKLYSYLWFKV